MWQQMTEMVNPLDEIGARSLSIGLGPFAFFAKTGVDLRLNGGTLLVAR